MKVADLFEAHERKLLAVIYPGRFQPFHKGHYAVYKRLCKWFGQDNVWIASSDKTTDPKDKEKVSFLDFQERKELMVSLYRINPDHIIQCKNPAFVPVEVLSLYKAPVVCVMAVGEKDVDRYQDSDLFDKYPMIKGRPVPFDQAADELSTANDKTKMYYVTVGPEAGNLSGTKVRERFMRVAPDKQDEISDAMKWAFGHDDPDVARMIIGNLKAHAPKKSDEKDVK